MSRLSMDLKVMPRLHKGHKNIMCIIDEVTNFLITVPIFSCKVRSGRRSTSRTCTNQILHTRIHNNQTPYRLSQMWTKYLSLAMFAYNTFNSPNLGNYSPYKLTSSRKPQIITECRNKSRYKSVQKLQAIL